MPSLTKKQRAIYKFITSFIDENGYAPTYQAIANNFALSSKATIHQHVTSLKKKGFLVDHASRSQVEPAPEMQTGKSIILPLVGLITAGEPIEAVEEKEQISVPVDLMVDPNTTYVLRVKGESMIDEGIYDGDFVVVQRDPSPKNGDVVVALLDNQYATLKKFYKEKSRIRLQPANPTMQPIYCKDLIIQGIVKAVIRKY